MNKHISLILTILILFQSCRVYHVKPVDLKEAVQSGKRVKIHTKDGEKLKFKTIILDSNQVYGVKRSKGKVVKIPINMDNIEKIRLHNKTMSIVLGVITSLTGIAVVSVVIFLATWNPSFVGPIASPI